MCVCGAQIAERTVGMNICFLYTQLMHEMCFQSLCLENQEGTTHSIGLFSFTMSKYFQILSIYIEQKEGMSLKQQKQEAMT